ncbi:MAG: hypothetical protein CM15mV128_280 [Caudoviricetes sp.]|nr:MAG: hypothetical protein CM15mV128_280 [Caudoviricetes sp.]
MKIEATGRFSSETFFKKLEQIKQRNKKKFYFLERFLKGF